MTTTLTAPPVEAPQRAKETVIDCDIHNAVNAPSELYPFLSEQWRSHLARVGMGPNHPGGVFPKHHPAAARVDAWPPGRTPGSDLDFMRRQLLDAWQIEWGVLNTLHFMGQQRVPALAAALSTALNAWQVARWLDPEPRLRASLTVPFEDGAAAAAEVERFASDRRFVQILLPVRTREPLGRRKYWPLYEAAERAGLPIAIHFGGSNGWPVTGAGWPSFYVEDHCGMAQSFQPQVVSLVCEGVFERFPSLQFILIEGGFAWLAPLMWRLDGAWKRLRAETPHLTRLPSELIREHCWFTTQPIEEPSKPEYFPQLLAQLGMNERALFATDYPHWDFDSPDQALPAGTRLPAVPTAVREAGDRPPAGLPPELRRRFMSGNARRLYHAD